jgi:hypothetical protein
MGKEIYHQVGKEIYHQAKAWQGLPPLHIRIAQWQTRELRLLRVLNGPAALATLRALRYTSTLFSDR